MRKYSVCVEMYKRYEILADSQEEACDTAKVLIGKEYPDWDVYADEENVREVKQ